MARAAKQKLARQSTAAYAASQPLFNSLRVGCARIGVQKANLTIARDLVQHLHVKLPTQITAGDAGKQERYLDSVVKAWRSATAVYADIFEALADITAPDASEGRAERDGHADFAEMARSAQLAKTTARSFSLHEDRATAATSGAKKAHTRDSDEDSEDDEDDDSASSSDVPASKPHDEVTSKVKPALMPTRNTPTNPVLLQLLGKRALPARPPQHTEDGPPRKVQRTSESIKYDAQGHKILWEKGADQPNVPFSTMGSAEKHAWKAEKRRQNSDKKKPSQKSAAGPAIAKVNGITGLESHLAPASATPISVSTVQYEDVSAEVDARLQAKEEKKAAAKKEKKRKRESGDLLEVPVEVEEIKIEKPKKKKSKATDGTKDDDVAVKKEKRKHHEADDGAGLETKKKRKKSKA